MPAGCGDRRARRIVRGSSCAQPDEGADLQRGRSDVGGHVRRRSARDGCEGDREGDRDRCHARHHSRRRRRRRRQPVRTRSLPGRRRRRPGRGGLHQQQGRRRRHRGSQIGGRLHRFQTERQRGSQRGDHRVFAGPGAGRDGRAHAEQRRRHRQSARIRLARRSASPTSARWLARSRGVRRWPSR